MHTKPNTPTNPPKALFAIPVFNWDGDGFPLLKTGFGIYWAVTLPLTALVFVFWAIAMLLPWGKWFAMFGRKRRLLVGDVELTVKRGNTTQQSSSSNV